MKKTLLLFFSLLVLLCTSCTDDVFNMKKAHSLQLSLQTITTDITDNKTFTIDAITKDKKGNIRNSSIIWEFSDPRKVTVLYKTSDSISFSVSESGKFVLSAYDQSNPSLKKAVIITATGALKSIHISENNVILNQKQEHTLNISFNPSEPSSKDVIWSSENTAIAKVTKISETEALVIAGVPGTTNIIVGSASNTSISTSCKITVSDLEIPQTSPRYIRLSESYITFDAPKGSKTITATIYDGNNGKVPGTIRWESNNPEIINVQSTGNTIKITPLAAGSAQITATMEENETITGTCNISVGCALQALILTKVDNPIKSRAIGNSITQISGAYPIGHTATYKVSYIPEKTTQTGVIWSSSSNSVSIYENNDYITITTQKTGNATVTATSKHYPSIRASIDIGIYDQNSNPDNNIQQIILDPFKAILTEGGESTTVSASVIYQDGKTHQTDLIWSSTSSIVDIKPLLNDGSMIEIIPKAKGETTVTATALSNPAVSSCVTVYITEEGELLPEQPSKLVTSTQSVTLIEGSTFDVKAYHSPNNSIAGNIIWNSKDNRIAAVNGVDKTATITANNSGTTIITAISSLLPDKPATINVNVVSEEEITQMVSLVVLSDTNLTILPPFSTDQTGLTATSYDSSGNEIKDTYTWEIDEPSLISGKIYNETRQLILTPLKSGNAIVKVKSTSNPNVTASASINIGGGITSIILSPNPLNMSLNESVYIEATLVPKDTIQTGIKWTISNSNVQLIQDKLNPLSVTLKGISTGNSTLTAESMDNSSIKTSLPIKILANQIQPADPHYMELSQSTISFSAINENSTIVATIRDGSNNEIPGVIRWESSNPEVAITSSSEKTAIITAKGIGSTSIIATMEGHEDISAQCYITVGNPLKALIITQIQNTNRRSLSNINDIQISGSFPIGKTATYKVSYIPTNTTQKGVTWQSSSNSVSIHGNEDYVTITANNEGSSMISATSNFNPDISANININVYDPLSNSDENISNVIIHPNHGILKINERMDLSATVYNQDGNTIDSNLIWTTSSSAASIEGNGNKISVKANNPGVVTITATALDNPYAKASSTILILNENEEIPNYPIRIISDISSKTAIKGSTFDINISSVPDLPIAENNLNWTVEGDGIISLQKSGNKAKVKALNTGNAKITVLNSLLPNNPITIDVKIIEPESVKPIVRNIILSDTSITLNPPFSTDQTGLTATSYDASENIVEDTYTWSINKTEYLQGRIYNNTIQYLLTPRKPGTATVIVRSKQNPAIFASAVINITGNLDKINLSPSTLKLSIGSKVSVSASLTPSNTILKNISWSITGDSVHLERDANDPYRVYVSAKKEGTSILKATSVDNPSVSTSCNINVLPGSIPEASKVDSIVLSQNTITIAPPVTTPAILSATVYDPDGLVYPTGVTWEVEDKTIAELTTQDSNRVSIIAKKAGETRIIARSITDPSISKSCILSVSGKIISIVPEKTYITLVNGTSTELKVKLNPSNTIETELNWTTEGSIDGSTEETPWVSLRPTASGCLITGLKVGETTVTVSSKTRPNVKADIAIVVTEAPKAQATITIIPTPIEISPTATRVKVTANVKPIGDSIINEDVVFRIDPVNIVDTTIGGSNEIYLIPKGIAGEGTIYAHLPSYPHIQEAIARLFVGGQLRSLAANGSQSVAVNVGETASIGISYNPTNTTETGIIWTSSNAAVARVNGGNAPDAIITGVSSGVATITATSSYYPDLKVEFTVVVKSIINEVAFTDQFDNKGSIFTTDTNTPLMLTCSMSPNIERKLIYKPKNTTFSMATLSGIDGTINDVLFTPDPELAGTYEYNITYEDRVIDVLTINTRFKGLSISSTREVFEGEYKTATLKVTSESGDVSSNQVQFSSSNNSVATVNDNGVITAKSPGEAIIYSETSGMQLQTRVYVNVEIPDSFEAALRATGYLSPSGDTILPADLNKITTLDLRNCPTTIAVDLSGIQKLPNLEKLIISDIKLASDKLSLYNVSNLKKVEANNLGIVSISNVPKGITEFQATNNLLSSYGFLSSTSVENVNLANNSITTFTKLPHVKILNLSNNKIATINTTSETLQTLNCSNNRISNITIDSSSLKKLYISGNDLTYKQGFLTTDKYLRTPNLEVLDLSDNYLGLKTIGTCPTCNKTYQSASSSTYSETEAQNQKQPLMTVKINWMQNLQELNLLNNHIRSGLNASDKMVVFEINSDKLKKIELRGNHIGNNYKFSNSYGSITKLPSASTYNTNGITINYDKGGCFYTSRSWYDYWDWYLQHKTGWSYSISHAYMY